MHSMRSWGLEPGQIEPFLALEDVMNDQGAAEALVQNISARMNGSQFGIILVRWQNGMGHAMVIESKFFYVKSNCSTDLGSLIGNLDFRHSTVWKNNFHASLILREINFG